MNKEEPYRDHAERSRQKINNMIDEQIVQRGLPSRSDVHRNNKNKTKWKLKFPIIRLLVLVFILLPIVIFSAYSSIISEQLNSSEKVSSEMSGFEEIKFEEREKIENKEQIESTNEEIAEEKLDQVQEGLQKSKIEQNQSSQVSVEETNIEKHPSTEKDQTSTPIQAEKQEENVIYHTVEPKETLFRIAMKYYQSQTGIEIIKTANHIQGNEIKVGQVLKIPK